MKYLVLDNFNPTSSVADVVAHYLTQHTNLVLISGDYLQNHQPVYRGWQIPVDKQLNLFEQVQNNQHAACKLNFQQLGYIDETFGQIMDNEMRVTDDDRLDSIVYSWPDSFASVHRIEYRDYNDQINQINFFNTEGRLSLIRIKNISHKTVLDQYLDDQGRVVIETTFENEQPVNWRWYRSTTDFSEFKTKRELLFTWVVAQVAQPDDQFIFINGSEADEFARAHPQQATYLLDLVQTNGDHVAKLIKFDRKTMFVPIPGLETIEHSGHNLLFVGPFDQNIEIKKVVGLLKAINKHYPEISVDFVGGGNHDGQLAQRIHEVLPKLQAQFFAKIDGTDVSALVELSQLAIDVNQTSRYPLLAMNILASGRGMVAFTNVAGMLKNEWNGQVVSSQNWNELENVVVQLLGDERAMALYNRNAKIPLEQINPEQTQNEWQQLIENIN